MTDIPRIFDDNSALIEIDPATLPEPMRARYAAIVAAFEANEQAQAELDDANAAVTSALAAVSNTTKLYEANWPKETFHDLWKQNFGGGPRNIMVARGLIK